MVPAAASLQQHSEVASAVPRRRMLHRMASCGICNSFVDTAKGICSQHANFNSGAQSQTTRHQRNTNATPTPTPVRHATSLRLSSAYTRQDKQATTHKKNMLSRAGAAALRSGSVRAARPLGATRQYHQNIVDHYENPRNVGSLDKAGLDVGTGLVGAPACGDVMKLQIRVSSDCCCIVIDSWRHVGGGPAV